MNRRIYGIFLVVFLLGSALGYSLSSQTRSELSRAHDESAHENHSEQEKTPIHSDLAETDIEPVDDLDSWIQIELDSEPSILALNAYALAFHSLPLEEQVAFFQSDLDALSMVQKSLYAELLAGHIRQFPDDFVQMLVSFKAFSFRQREYFFALFASIFPERAMLLHERIEKGEFPDFVQSEEGEPQLKALLANVLAKHPNLYEKAMELYLDTDGQKSGILLTGSTPALLAEYDPEWVLLQALTEDGQKHPALLEAAINKIADYDVDRAAAYIIEHKHLTQKSPLRPVVEAFMENGNIAGLANLYQQLGPFQDEYVYHFVQGSIKSQLSSSGVDTMLEFVENITDEKIRREAINAIKPRSVPSAFFTESDLWRLQKAWIEPYIGEKFVYDDIGLLAVLYPRDKSGIESYIKSMYEDPKEQAKALTWMRRSVF